MSALRSFCEYGRGQPSKKIHNPVVALFERFAFQNNFHFFSFLCNHLIQSIEINYRLPLELGGNKNLDFLFCDFNVLLPEINEAFKCNYKLNNYLK